MTLQKFYCEIGGNSNNILERLGDESFIKKYIVKFLNDPTFELIKTDIEKQDVDKANFDAHTLKGICALLEFVKLKQLAEQLMLCLKQNKNIKEAFLLLENEYNLIVKTIQKSNWC